MKAYTNIEQSKKLAEMLLIESADHHYVRKVNDFIGKIENGDWSVPKYGNPNSKHANYIVQNFTSYEVIPCWSVASLLEVLPSGKLLLHDKKTKMYKLIYTLDSAWHDNPVDACYEMILKLHEQKLL